MFPIAASADGYKFRRLAVQIENGDFPDELNDQKSLSDRELAFFTNGYNSGMLPLSLRLLADVIDFDQLTVN